MTSVRTINVRPQHGRLQRGQAAEAVAYSCCQCMFLCVSATRTRGGTLTTGESATELKAAA